MGRGSHTETFRYLATPISKLWVVDNILPEHVELPHVLDLAVHLVQMMTCMGRGVILRPLGTWLLPLLEDMGC